MDFIPIRGFMGYSVSISGLIRNDDTGRYLVQTRNGHGVVQVGMMRNGVQCKRSVALIVAHTFLDPPTPSAFDTPIHLDGNRWNNAVDNLMWRPRWFAVKYGQQFREFEKHGPTVAARLIEVHTKMRFRDSWHAATMFGLLDDDIRTAVTNRHYVWPTYQEFRRLE